MASSSYPMRRGTSLWKFAPRAPMPPKYSAYMGRSMSAAASTSSCTISGTVAATSKESKS